jgi:hypothetical protein
MNTGEGDEFGEDLLSKRDLKISSLEAIKECQDEEIAKLRKELNALEILHKEEVYWLRLELDSVRCKKEFAEDRISILCREMRGLNEDEISHIGSSADPAIIPTLLEHISKNIRAMEILEHQSDMVRQSCDDTVENLKGEIADLLDEKVRMEMSLLNQLACLDSEKRNLETDLKVQIKMRDEIISRLSAKRPSTFIGENEFNEGNVQNEISILLDKARSIQEELDHERNEADETIAQLEETNNQLRIKIDKMKSELEAIQQGLTTEAIHVLDSLKKEKQDTLSTLDRVSRIWEKVKESNQSLEYIMDELRPRDDNLIADDLLLSTLETSSLVHAQMKVSLLLVELKLRNQLGSLEIDKLRIGSTSSFQKSFLKHMQEIKDEALAALHEVEDNLTDQFLALERRAIELTTRSNDLLKELTENEHPKLQTPPKAPIEITTSSNSNITTTHTSERQLWEEDAADQDRILVSRKVLARFQTEVLTVIQRLQEKNDYIAHLQESLEENNVREAALKKELKRMLKLSRGFD